MKHWLRFAFLGCCTFLMAAVGAAAAEPEAFHNALSLQGFTGILNTPNAHVTDEGWLYALYSNQTEPQWRQKTSFQDNYQFSLGFFNFIELGSSIQSLAVKQGSFPIHILNIDFFTLIDLS